MANLLSIVMASINQDKMTQVFDNFEETARDMDSFEVLVKVDDDHPEMIAFMEREKNRRPFTVKYIATPKQDGYWSLYLAYNELWAMASPDTYFVCGFNDETKFETRHWDEILKKYVGYYPDGVFHLRISQRRRLEFKSLLECLSWGESYGLFTKKWLFLTEGLAVGEACMDTGQECVNFFLRTQCGCFRGVAVDDIRIANEEIAVSAGHGLTPQQIQKKMKGAHILYAKLLTQPWIERYYRLACKIHAYVWACEYGGEDFTLEEDKTEKNIVIKTCSSTESVKSFPYKVELADWISVLCNTRLIKSNDPRAYDAWPPLLANQILARGQLAQHWINTPNDQLEKSCIGDLGKAHRQLLNISIRNNPLGAINLCFVHEIIRNISGGDFGLQEPAFVSHIIKGLFEKGSIQYFLAASLYCRDGELLSHNFQLNPLLQRMLVPLERQL